MSVSMFFSERFSHAPGLERPSVVALFSDPSIGEIRIKPYLDALLGRGVVGRYLVADRAMQPSGGHGSREPFRFTHIWCQRSPSTRQSAFLRKHRAARIIYDLDDLLTSVPPLVMKTRRRTLKRVRWCLENAAAITVANETLAKSLAQDVNSVAGAIIVLKNGCHIAAPAFPLQPRRRVIWTSGDHPFILREQATLVPDLAGLADRLGLEVVLIGRFDPALAASFTKHSLIPFLDFRSYREFLRLNAGSIGIAPLPARMPADVQRYFDAKSDIKLVDFLSSGIIPFVSRALPYLSSDLFLPVFGAADSSELSASISNCLQHYPSVVSLIQKSMIPDSLKRREFAELSKALDHLFTC